MFKLLKGLAVLTAVMSTIGSASAASLYDIDITFSNSNALSTFSLSSLSLAPSTNLADNLLGSFSPGPYAGSGTILNEVVSLVTGTSYSFSFNGSTIAAPATAFSGNATIFASTVTTSTNTTLDNGNFSINIGSALSPVPLPAGFPLFAMGLIALGAFGYHSLRSRKNGELTAAV
jgi:hypothetical protein